ncbi:hypothetical protein [Streptomyces mirabilis]
MAEIVRMAGGPTSITVKELGQANANGVAPGVSGHRGPVPSPPAS